MPLTPLTVNGRVRLVQMESGVGSRRQWELREEEARRAAVQRRRRYYEGSQYDDENEQRQKDEMPGDERLPEHRRLHAYSTQIAEAVDFLSDQLAESFGIVPEDAEVEEVLTEGLKASPQFTGDDSEAEISVTDVVRDGMIAGDVPVFIRWDPVEQRVWPECWESEKVEFRFADQQRLERVERTEVRWVVNADGEEQEVVERVVYRLAVNEFEELDCVVETFHDDDDAPRDRMWLSLPFIPWTLLRTNTKGLRQQRGESLITEQAIDTADRYNAVEQVGWLIARYNSHANLAAIGDATHLQARQEGHIEKDVADVLTFPGGTDVKSITLPTDTDMIEHQRTILADHLYGMFGLIRVDTETISNAPMSGISGYALEILNRRTEGTFRRVRRMWRRDFRGMLDLMLDVFAYRDAQTTAMVDDEGEPAPNLADVDPQTRFPNRKVEVRLGTGYVVDVAELRKDFSGNVLSRRETLRQRGYGDEKINQIEREIAQEQSGPAEGTSVNGQGVPVGRL